MNIETFKEAREAYRHTHKEFQKDIVSIESAIRDNQNEWKKIEAEYVAEHCEYSIGDKITIKHQVNVGARFTPEWEDTESKVWIYKIYPRLRNGAVVFHYGFKRIKVDGTKSSIKFERGELYCQEDLDNMIVK